MTQAKVWSSLIEHRGEYALPAVVKLSIHYYLDTFRFFHTLSFLSKNLRSSSFTVNPKLLAAFNVLEMVLRTALSISLATFNLFCKL